MKPEEIISALQLRVSDMEQEAAGIREMMVDVFSVLQRVNAISLERVIEVYEDRLEEIHKTRIGPMHQYSAMIAELRRLKDERDGKKPKRHLRLVPPPEDPK